MANTYPTTLNTHKTDWANTTPVADTHPEEHNDIANAVAALEAKVGADSSAVTTSHDYKLSAITSTAKAVSTSGNQSISGNKTFSGDTTLSGSTVSISTSGALSATRPKITTSIDDVNGNEVIETPATASAVNHAKITNAATGNAVSIESAGGDTNIGLTIKPKGTGAFKLGAGELVFPATDGNSSEFLKTDGAGNLSFADVSITVKPDIISMESMGSLTNQGFMDSIIYVVGNTTTLAVQLDGEYFQSRTITSDWADADNIRSWVYLGGYLFVMLEDAGATPDAFRVYRYDPTNLSAGGTQITFSGKSLTATDSLLYMTSDGTYIYFNFDAGNTANSYDIAKFSVSGTTFTFVSTITCGSTASDVERFVVKASGDIYGFDYTSTTIVKITKFNSSGTAQSNSGTISFPAGDNILSYGDKIYCASTTHYTNISLE